MEEHDTGVLAAREAARVLLLKFESVYRRLLLLKNLQIMVTNVIMAVETVDARARQESTRSA